MLATTALIALSRRIADDRAKKKEAKASQLVIGESSIARDAFASHTKAIRDSHLGRAGTDIKWDNANELSISTPTSPRSPRPEEQESRDAGRVDSHTKPLSITAPLPEMHHAQNPPPYSATSDSRPSDTSSPSDTSPSNYSRTTSALSPSATRPTSDATPIKSSSLHSPPASSSNGVAIRVKTNGTDLKSGFPYHPALFDLKVRPDEWDRFCSQVTQATKFGGSDHAKMWAAATATALTGAIATSVWVGRTMNRSLQEKKVKAGLQDMSDGGLGDTLQQWNKSYFHSHGLFVHLELSESALKASEQKSKTLPRHYLVPGSREERDRRREERKFVIVVTKLDEHGVPVEAINGMIAEIPAENSVTELASPQDARYHIAEMPGDDGHRPVELPAAPPAGTSLGYGGDFKPAEGYAELPADTIELPDRSRSNSRQGLLDDPFADKNTAQRCGDEKKVDPAYSDSAETLRSQQPSAAPIGHSKPNVGDQP